MNTLIIVANPRVESFSFALVNKYKELALLKKHNVDVIDLYREKNHQPFYYYEDANIIETTKEMKYFQDKIIWADELVFVFPYWWGGMPSILKNFIEWNFSSGFAFKYINSRSKGLLNDKTVKIYTTTGTPSFIYKITGVNRRIRKTIQKQILEFCGMKLTSFNMYGGLDRSATKPNEILEKIRV